MEATYGGTGRLPPDHLHPRQIERFEVLEGTMRTIIGGAERWYGPGETFEVPAGTPHRMTAEVPAQVLGRETWPGPKPDSAPDYFRQVAPSRTWTFSPFS
jgi:mannose-6-phosphate isomerase-like protein (cupin superfamily)